MAAWHGKHTMELWLRVQKLVLRMQTSSALNQAQCVLCPFWGGTQRVLAGKIRAQHSTGKTKNPSPVFHLWILRNLRHLLVQQGKECGATKRWH